MKTLVALVPVLIISYASSNLQAASPELEAAKTDGARGMITLRVVDSKGIPVENAQVSAWFYNPHNRNDTSERMTDTNGLCSITGVSDSQMRYTITKAGYYKTSEPYWFYRRGENCVQNGRWQPWNPTNAVVLKEVRHPIPMRAKRVDAPVPVQGTPAGYDLEVGDWVAPYGQGKQPDMLVTYEATIKAPLVFSNQLTIATSNKLDGFIRMSKDKWSTFVSVYEAPTNGYLSPVVL